MSERAQALEAALVRVVGLMEHYWPMPNDEQADAMNQSYRALAHAAPPVGVSPQPCSECGGDGEVIIGENRVTLDMAIDAGDRALAGYLHSYAYGQCGACDGTGVTSTALSPVEPTPTPRCACGGRGSGTTNPAVVARKSAAMSEPAGLLTDGNIAPTAASVWSWARHRREGNSDLP